MSFPAAGNPASIMLTLLVLQELRVVCTACGFSAGLAEVANASSSVGEVQQFCKSPSQQKQGHDRMHGQLWGCTSK